MTILYLHQYFALPSSSGGTRSYDLAKRFTKEGHKVTVITSSSFINNFQKFNKTWTVVNYESIELHVLKLEYSNKLSFTKRVLTFCKFFVLGTLRALKIKGDIVVATSTPITIAIPALVKKYFHHTPYIFEVRDVWPEVPIAMGVIKNKLISKVLNHFEQYIYKNSAHIVALSDDMKKSILGRVNMPEDKVSVITNISETERFAVANPGLNQIESLIGYEPEKVVLYAGTLGMVNGLKYMLELAIQTQMIDPGIKFLIFGDGMEKEELIAFSRRHGILNTNVYFCNPIPKSALSQLYHECTVASSFVIPIPELWSNSANKFFDCLAAGKPIVINHRGWQAEVIERENVGFVLNHDIKKINQEAARFCEYLNNSNLLEKQSENAKRLAEKRYSLYIASSNYLRILDNVIPKPSEVTA